MQGKVSSLEEKIEEIYDYHIDTDEVENKDKDKAEGRKKIDNVAEENSESRDGCKQKKDFYDQTRVKNTDIILLLKKFMEQKKTSMAR